MDKLYEFLDSEFDASLIKTKLIDAVDEIDAPALTEEILLELCESPSPLKFNGEGELITVLKDGDTIVFDPKATEVTDFIEYIPDCPFDVECGGRHSLQQEAIAIYKIALVNQITGRTLDDEIKAILSDGYDFKELKGPNVSMPFFDLLCDILLDKSAIIELVMLAANFKLLANSEKKGTPYTGIVNKQDVTELDSIKRRLSAVHYKLSEDIKKADSKLERLKLMEAARNEADLVLSAHSERIVILWRIYKLDVSSVPFIAQRKIRRLTNEFFQKQIDASVINNIDEAAKIKARLRKRGKKQVLAQIKRNAYIKFYNNDLEGIIPKT